MTEDEHTELMQCWEIASPYAGLNYAVQMGTWVGRMPWPLDHDVAERVVEQTVLLMGPRGASAGRWDHTEQSVFMFVTRGDLMMFLLRWRGQPEPRG